MKQLFFWNLCISFRQANVVLIKLICNPFKELKNAMKPLSMG